MKFEPTLLYWFIESCDINGAGAFFLAAQTCLHVVDKSGEKNKRILHAIAKIKYVSAIGPENVYGTCTKSLRGCFDLRITSA